MADEEEAVAVCMPVSQLQASSIIAGSLKKPCFECHQEVWISPVTFAKTTKIICIPCILMKNPRNSDFHLDPEQLKEMRSHLQQRKLGLSGEASN